MPTDMKNPLPTQGLPTFYANAAGLSIGYHDIRIFLADASPIAVDLGPSTPGLKPLNVLTSPVACIIVNPEFAKSLRDSLNSAIEKYEASFGGLRPDPKPLPLETPAP